MSKTGHTAVNPEGVGARSPRGCEGYAMNLGAYFVEGRRESIRCPRPAWYRVNVNPPRPGDDGTVLLCELHNQLDYVGYTRTLLSDPTTAEDPTPEPTPGMNP